MTTTEKKLTVTTPNGNEFSVLPGTENPLAVREWLKQLAKWREENKELVARISVDEFLAEKHAETEREYT